MEKLHKWLKVTDVLLASFFCYQCIKYTLDGNVGIVVASFCTMVFIRSSEMYLQMAIDYRAEAFSWREATFMSAELLKNCREEKKIKWESTR